MTETARFDFFLSRRGSVAAIAREVADVLMEAGYRVVTQDYDIPLGASFVDAMHEAIKNSRDLVVLFTRDYEASPYTRKEFTSFEAERSQSTEQRRIVILRCEDVPLRGLFADTVYQDLVGVGDPQERKRRILAAVEGQSQALAPPPRAFVGVPPRIVGFTGRDHELDRLDAVLMGEQAATAASVGRVALEGMGGVGKTSLAVEYASRFRNLYAGVWWCPAETRAGLCTSLAALAVMLGAASADEADVEKAAAAALRRLAEQRATWLLVYDNVAAPEDVADLLPAAGARVLITSRFADWGGWAEEVPVGVLSLGEAATFLQSRAGRNDEAGARKLAEDLGQLPLALDHAAAYCKRTQMRFSDYATKASSLIASAPRGVGYPRSVAATFDLAIAQAVEQCPAADPLIAFLAQCAPEQIPMALVEGAIEDDIERLEALARLSEMSLVRHDPFEDGEAAVTMHRLVQAAARTRARTKGMAHPATRRIIEQLSAIYPEQVHDDPVSWPLCARLTPHLLAQHEADPDGSATIDALPDPWPDLLDRAGLYLVARAAYGQAMPLLRSALALRETKLGPDHPDTAISLGSLASALRHQGDLVQARPLLERALAINETALGPEHPATEFDLNHLTVLLSDLGDLAAARPLAERAVAIAEASGVEQPGAATALNNLARVFHLQGDLARARPLYERALALSERARGPEHPTLGYSLTNLATLSYQQGDLPGARKFSERVMAIHEKSLGPDHPETAESQANLAYMLQQQGDLSGARMLNERALAVREAALGPDHPATVVSLNNLARVLQDLRHRAEAWIMYERAQEVCDRLLGPEDPLTHRVQGTRARLLLADGAAKEALAVAEAAHGALERILGGGHPFAAESARLVAQALSALNRTAEAAELRRRYGLIE